MIYEDLREEIPNLSLGTVYRNLRQLEESGRIVRAATVDNRERYDAFCDDHAHFVCEGCGQVLDLMEADMEKARSACSIGGSAVPKRISIVVSGVCGQCHDRQKQQISKLHRTVTGNIFGGVSNDECKGT